MKHYHPFSINLTTDYHTYFKERIDLSSLPTAPNGFNYERNNLDVFKVKGQSDMNINNEQIDDTVNVCQKTTKKTFEFNILWEKSPCNTPIETFLNYKQHKVGISGNHFFPFDSFVIFITCILTHKFAGK